MDITTIIKNVSLVHISTSAEECEHRDVKGMWERAKQGLIRGFTGYDADYNIPENADLTLNTENKSINDCLDQLRKLI